MTKHFVHFLSPGTLVAEETVKPIDSWDVDTAVQMAHSINERYGARPYGFQFSTRERGDTDLDSKVIKTSGIYYLGGRTMTAEDVRREIKDPETLLANMKGNRWEKVVVNDNSYRWIQPLLKGDTVLDVKLPALKK